MDERNGEKKEFLDQKTIEGLVLFGVITFVVMCVLLGLRVLGII